MMVEASTFTPKGQTRQLVRRPTALGVAFAELADQMGLDRSKTKVPMKYEPVVSVRSSDTRRSKRRKR